MHPTVVVISSDEAYLKRTTALIKGEGFIVEGFRSFAPAARRLSGLDPGIIVLDEQLSEASVWDCCAQLRSQSRAPILITGPKGDARHTVKAINQGADFYLKRPFHDMEFMARIKALLRRRDLSLQSAASGK